MLTETFTLPTIGILSIERILVGYDGPRIFVTKSATDARYLCYWAAELEGADRWWLIPVSEARLEQIEQRRMTLRDGIRQSESGSVFQFEWPDDASVPSAYGYVQVGAIPSEELPGAESFLPKRPIRQKRSEVQPAPILALQLQRPVLRLRMLTPGHEASAGRVASLLTSLQGSIDAFGQAFSGRISERGMIPQPIVEQTALALSAVYAGSLGVELVGEELQLFPDSLLVKAVDTLNQIFNDGGDFEALRKVFGDVRHKRSITRYKNLLEALVDVESDVEMTWAQPHKPNEVRKLLRQVDVARSLESLYREELSTTATEEIVGELIGINKRTKRFELRAVEGDEKISGRILQSAMDAARRATLSSMYKATVVRTEEYQPITDEETKRFELLGLVELIQPSDAEVR